MKKSIRILVALFALGALSLSAWNIASARNGQNPAGEIELTGIVESIQPSTWTVSGLTVEVQPTTEVKDAIQVGDLAKIHAQRMVDGVLTAREIELAGMNDQPSVDDNSSSSSSSDTSSGSSSDDRTDLSNSSEIEFYGTVQSIDGEIYLIDGRQVAVTVNTEVEDTIQVGDRVEVHAWVAEDGSLTAREIELASADDASSDDDHDGEDEDGSDHDEDDSDHASGSDGHSGDDDSGNP